MVSALSAFAAPAASTRPVLTVSPEAMVISGARFKANELVTLRLVVLGRTTVKTVRTTRVGRLTARFSDRVPECSGFTVSAVGNRGSRVLFRELPPPCGIVIQP
jgi:hypothetical protein